VGGYAQAGLPELGNSGHLPNREDGFSSCFAITRKVSRRSAGGAMKRFYIESEGGRTFLRPLCLAGPLGVRSGRGVAVLAGGAEYPPRLVRTNGNSKAEDPSRKGDVMIQGSSLVAGPLGSEWRT
jgi:hypothetical protein